MSLTDSCQDTISITRVAPGNDVSPVDTSTPAVVNDPDGNPLTNIAACIQTPSAREFLKFGASQTEFSDVAYTESNITTCRKDDQVIDQNGNRYKVWQPQDMGGQRIAFALYMKRLG